MKVTESAEIFQTFHRDIYRYVFSRTFNREVAEDITAEAFKRMLEQKHFDKVKAKPWLLTVARNLVFDRTKSAAIKLSAGDELLTSQIDKSANQEEKVIQEILMRDLLKFLPSLQNDVAEIITLKVWDELQFNEIAGVVGENESTVKQKYYRGLEKLKALVQQNHQKPISEELILASLLLITKKPALSPSAAFSSGFVSRHLSQSKPRFDYRSLLAGAALIIGATNSVVIYGYDSTRFNLPEAEICQASKELVDGSFVKADEIIQRLVAEDSRLVNFELIKSDTTHAVNSNAQNYFAATKDLEKFKQTANLSSSTQVVIGDEIFDTSGNSIGSCAN